MTNRMDARGNQQPRNVEIPWNWRCAQFVMSMYVQLTLSPIRYSVCEKEPNKFHNQISNVFLTEYSTKKNKRVAHYSVIPSNIQSIRQCHDK